MNNNILMFSSLVSLVTALALSETGCHSGKTQTVGNVSSSASASQPVITAITASITNPVASPLPVAKSAIRIKAGTVDAFKDSAGNLWVADQGFNGGDVIERPDLTIANTAEPGIYRSEHYGMDSFSFPLANGKYVVKLHFCETYEGVDGSGQRVFSFNVQGREFKDFDVWAKAGGALKAYVESVPVEITNGKLLITFTSNVENPQINGIEIIPQI